MSTLIALIGLEIASRYILPFSPGAKTVALDGTPIKKTAEGRYRYRANLSYRQISEEFDARVTIDRSGNRVTGPSISVEDPDTILLGDSFTFGHGLNDEETFAYKYCTSLNLNCANMGRSGSGTLVQLDVLENYLDTEQWKPAKVKLFILAMTSTLMSGNDLLDNFYYVKLRAADKKDLSQNSGASEKNKVKAPAHIDIWLALRTQTIKHSNLARILYFYFAPILRSVLSPAPQGATLDVALAATKEALERLQNISTKYGFAYEVYIIHPIQDILRKSDRQTRDIIAKLSPITKMFDTADLLKNDPSKYYFSFDGHLNKEGADRIAEFLINQDRQ
jgi:hypothetical protein